MSINQYELIGLPCKLMLKMEHTLVVLELNIFQKKL